MPPTDQQKQIIEDKSKFIQVQAGPGTGKTYTLIRKTESLLRDGTLLPLEKVLFCTYTNALTSSNLQSLCKDLSIDISRVKARTLDSLVIEVLCSLSISDTNKSILNAFEGDYGKAKYLSVQLLQSHGKEIVCILEFMVKRYPYIFIDEIQDIKNKEEGNDSPKFQFLSLIQKCKNLKQMVIVGDTNQNLYNQNDTAFSFDVTPHKMNRSHRKDVHTGDSATKIVEAIKGHEDTVQISIQEGLKRIIKDPLESDVMVIIQVLSRFSDSDKAALKTIPSFWYGGDSNGQYTLPQAIVNSLFWYRDLTITAKIQPLEALLLPFKSELAADVQFSYFKCKYFNLLQSKNINFEQFITEILNELDANKNKVQQLIGFLNKHTHLHKINIPTFKNKIVVSTIDSAKGLQAKDIYLLLNGTNRSPQHTFVAHTRHTNKLYICS